VTIQQYYSGFVNLFGVAASVPFIPPLLHLFMPESSAFADYLYPPLGDFEWIGVAATIGVLIVSTFVVFHYGDSTTQLRRRMPAILLVVMVLSTCGLLASYVWWVRRVPVAAANLDVPVSIGYHKTEFALRTYNQQETDWEILDSVGVKEYDVRKIWTSGSVCVVRIALWFLYTVIVSCFLSVISLAVYRHVVETVATNPVLTPTPPATTP
jgi:hypothetical protein